MKKFNWIFFGVAINIIPLAAILFFKWGIGYEINGMDYAPDIILIALSIGGGLIYNVVNESIDKDRRKEKIPSEFLMIGIGTGFVTIFLGIIYGSLVSRITQFSSKVFERYNSVSETLSVREINGLMEALEEYTTECFNNMRGAHFIKLAIIVGVVFTVIGLWFEELKDRVEKSGTPEK